MARGARDYQFSELSFMTHEQLVETCLRLESRRQMMDILLAELQNEKTKLQRHRTMLTERIERVEGCSSGAQLLQQTSRGSEPRELCRLAQPASMDIPLQQQGARLLQQVRPEKERAPAGQNTPTGGGDAAAGAVTMSATIAGILSGQATGPSSPTSAAVSLPSSLAALSTVSVDGQLSAQKAVMQLGHGTSDSTMASSTPEGLARALQERFAVEIPIPEELLARQQLNGSISLTWFYNEQILEQLADPTHPLMSLSFEVRQQSEGANGRLRLRSYDCDCRAIGESEEVGEQGFEVEGCVLGRPYSFSVRAVAQFDGEASLVYSAYCESVAIGCFSASNSQSMEYAPSASEGQSTTRSTPRSEFRSLSTWPSVPDTAVQSLADRPVPGVPGTGDAPFGEDSQIRAQEALRAEEAARRREEAAVAMLEETRKRLEEEAAHRRAEEEARKRAEDQRRLVEEAAQRRAVEEEVQRQLDQEAAQRRFEEEVHQRVEEQRLRLEEETRQREAEIQRRANEALRAQEEARIREEEEALRRRAAEEEGRRQEREETQRRVEEEVNRRLAEERRRLAEEARLQQEEAQRRLEEETMQQRQEEEQRLQREAEAWRQLQEDERKQFAEEMRRAEEEVQRRLEAEVLQRKIEEERRRQEEEVRRQAEEEARLRDNQRWQRENEELQRLAKEAQQAEADARRRLEEETTQRMLEEERRRQAEELAQRRAEEDARLEEQQRKEHERQQLAQAAQQREDARKREEEEEEERRLQVEAVQRRVEEEIRRRSELEEQRRQEEEARQLEAARRAQEEEEAQRQEEEDLQRRVEAQIRSRVEAEAKRRQEEEARRQAEEEQRRLDEEEFERVKEEEASRKRAEEDQRRRVEEEQRRLQEAAAQQRIEDEVRRRAEEEVRRWAAEEARRNAEEPARQRTRAAAAESSADAAATEEVRRSPAASSFAQGFEQYCNNKASETRGGAVGVRRQQGSRNTTTTSGRVSPAGPPPGVEPHKTGEANGAATSPMAKAATAAFQLEASLGSHSPMTLPNSAARSPVDGRSPKGEHSPGPSSENVVSPKNSVRASNGSAGADAEKDPMDKWMSKILADKGPPPMALQPTPVEPPALTAPPPLPGAPPPVSGRDSCGGQVQRPADQQRVAAANHRLRASTPGNMSASHEPPKAAAGARQSLASSMRPELRHKSQSPLAGESRRPAAKAAASGSSGRPGAAIALAPAAARSCTQPVAGAGGAAGAAGQGLDGMVTVMQLPKRSSPTGAMPGRTLQPSARNPSMGPISEATRHVADPGAARISEATRHISVEQGIPIGDTMRRQGASGASSPVGGSMIFSSVTPTTAALPRAQTFSGQKPVSHGVAVSPFGTSCLNSGSAVGPAGGVQPPRSSSFSAYPSADGRPPTSAASGYSAVGPAAGQSPYSGSTRRGLSPVRSPAPVAPHRAQQPAQAPASQMRVQAAPPPISPQRQSCPGEHRPGLEVTQRMQQANDLQQRLLANKPPAAAPPAQLPPGVNLNTPSLLNWAKELGQPARLAPAHEMMSEDVESPFGDADPLGMGMATLHNLPPPPRSAPAAAEAAAAYSGGGCYEAGAGGGNLQFSLTVLTSDNRWETLGFSARDNLERQANAFLHSKGLKAAFRSGLVAKMQSMIGTRQTNSSVDIVDLI